MTGLQWPLVLALATVLGCASPPPPNPNAARIVFSQQEPGDNFEQVGPVTGTDGAGCGVYGARGSYEKAVVRLQDAAADMGADYVAVTLTEPPHVRPGCMVNRFLIQGMAYRKIADAPSPTRIDATVSDGDAPSGLADDLRQLDELRRQGVLTDEEFERAKAKLLAE